eukprot:TRINITY_DN140_c0_g1_i3.p1 TRINITY_DN140_c0_g1~~TRINITY_DN140_c0_g1_i3.p1  ORF type:complete len:250 (-),score=35.36 TRINITY_DN140_c0_g1_i3:605-1354(-)
MQQQDYKRVASAPKQDSSHASRAVRSHSEGEEEIEVELPTIRSTDGRSRSQRDKYHPRSPGEYPAPHATLLDNPPQPGGKEHKQQHQQHNGAVMGRGKQYLRLNHSDSRHEHFIDQEAQAIAEAEEELQFELEAGDQIGEHFGGTDGVPGGEPGAIPCAFISGRPLVYLCAACSSLCSVLLGYDVGVMSGAKVRANKVSGAARFTGVATHHKCTVRSKSWTAHGRFRFVPCGRQSVVGDAVVNMGWRKR